MFFWNFMLPFLLRLSPLLPLCFLFSSFRLEFSHKTRSGDYNQHRAMPMSSVTCRWVFCPQLTIRNHKYSEFRNKHFPIYYFKTFPAGQKIGPGNRKTTRKQKQQKQTQRNSDIGVIVWGLSGLDRSAQQLRELAAFVEKRSRHWKAAGCLQLQRQVFWDPLLASERAPTHVSHTCTQTQAIRN